MKRTINARPRFLRTSTLFVALCFSFGQLFAQVQISATVPTGQSEALNVGVGTANFGVSIANTGSSVVHINALVVDQPAGVSIVSATASIATTENMTERQHIYKAKLQAILDGEMTDR